MKPFLTSPGIVTCPTALCLFLMEAFLYSPSIRTNENVRPRERVVCPARQRQSQKLTEVSWLLVQGIFFFFLHLQDPAWCVLVVWVVGDFSFL